MSGFGRSLFPVFFITLITFPHLERVCATEAEGNDAAYLFSYFTKNGEDGLHLAYSFDGLKWKPVREGKPLLTPQVGGKLMRDPCVISGPEGKFHMVWTVGWWEKGIGIAHSTDLLKWSAQQVVPVMAHEATARNSWAPEILWDARRKEYLIYWSSTIPGRFPQTEKTGDDGLNHRVYCVTTKDFRTYSKTKLFFDPGFNVIDPVIVAHDNGYAMVLKDETRHPPAKNFRVAFSKELSGPWEVAKESFTPKGVWVEGPTLLKIGDWWHLYFDRYTDGKYGVMRTKDFRKWKDLSDQLQMPKGIRHGTAFRVDRSILQNLENQNGGE